MELKEQILEILEELAPGIDYASCTTLIDDRHIDSLAMVALIAELEEVFDVEIPPVLIVPANFNSLDAICALVKKLQDEAY